MDIMRDFEHRGKWVPLIDKKRVDEYASEFEVALEKMDDLDPSIAGQLRRSLGGYVTKHKLGNERYIITSCNFAMKEITEGFEKLKQRGSLQWSVESLIMNTRIFLTARRFNAQRDI